MIEEVHFKMCLALKGFRDDTPESVAYSFSERGALSDYTTRYFKTFKTRKFLTIKQKEEEETRVFNSVLKYFLQRVLHYTLFSGIYQRMLIAHPCPRKGRKMDFGYLGLM